MDSYLQALLLLLVRKVDPPTYRLMQIYREVIGGNKP